MNQKLEKLAKGILAEAIAATSATERRELLDDYAKMLGIIQHAKQVVAPKVLKEGE